MYIPTGMSNVKKIKIQTDVILKVILPKRQLSFFFHDICVVFSNDIAIGEKLKISDTEISLGVTRSWNVS